MKHKPLALALVTAGEYAALAARLGYRRGDLIVDARGGAVPMSGRFDTGRFKTKLDVQVVFDEPVQFATPDWAAELERAMLQATMRRVARGERLRLFPVERPPP